MHNVTSKFQCNKVRESSSLLFSMKKMRKKTGAHVFLWKFFFFFCLSLSSLRRRSIVVALTDLIRIVPFGRPLLWTTLPKVNSWTKINDFSLSAMHYSYSSWAEEKNRIIYTYRYNIVSKQKRSSQLSRFSIVESTRTVTIWWKKPSSSEKEHSFSRPFTKRENREHCPE